MKRIGHDPSQLLKKNQKKKKFQSRKAGRKKRKHPKRKKRKLQDTSGKKPVERSLGHSALLGSSSNRQAKQFGLP
jgi:hypothetical protein